MDLEQLAGEVLPSAGPGPPRPRPTWPRSRRRRPGPWPWPGATVRVQAAAQAEVEASLTMLRQAIENLIDNSRPRRARRGRGRRPGRPGGRPGRGGGGRPRRRRGARGRARHRAVRGPPVPGRGRRDFMGCARDGGGTRRAACRCGASRQTGSTGQRRQHLNASRGAAMRQPVRVVLADDHDAFVEGLGMVPGPRRPRSSPWRATAPRPSRPSSPTIPTCWWSTPRCPARPSPSWCAWSARPSPRPGAAAGRGRPAGPVQPARPGRPRRHDPGVSARELAEAIRAVAAGFRVTWPTRPRLSWPHPAGGSATDQPRPSQAGRPRRAAAAQPVGARAPGPGPARPWLLQPPHRRCLLPVAQHGPHPRPERAGQAGRTLQAGGGRAGRAPGAGRHRGPIA